jgi:glycosyltransferase involved in cell wall biosynthesis
MFAGVMSEVKGAGDVLVAWERLQGQGADVRLAMFGEGPVRERVLAHAGARQGRIEAPGRVSHDEVIRRMRTSDLIVVPSRHEFTEGLPMVIQEALALRTPLVLSDHPVFTGYLKEGQGARFFPAGDADALARVVNQTLTDPSGYAQLSEATAAAWRSLQIDTKFHHVLDSLAAKWKMPDRPAPSVAQPPARATDETSSIAPAVRADMPKPAP